MPVWVGVDAAPKRDSTGITVCTFERDTRMVRLVWHQIFQPSPKAPLDFEADIEATLLGLKARFNVRQVYYDPYHMAATAQRMQRAGLPMVEFPQTPGNLTAANQNLFELIRSQNIVVYPDDEIRLAISRAIAVESARGWRLDKAKQNHKIDVVVSLSMAALAAVRQGGRGRVWCNGLAVGSDGLMIDHPNPQMRSRDSAPGLRIVRVTEKEALRQKEAGEW